MIVINENNNMVVESQRIWIAQDSQQEDKSRACRICVSSLSGNKTAMSKGYSCEQADAYMKDITDLISKGATVINLCQIIRPHKWKDDQNKLRRAKQDGMLPAEL